MNKREWKKKYKQRIREIAGWTEKEAEMLYQAGVPSKTMPDWGHDYSDDPIDAADDEMECWEN
jgi:hypothetical protein